MMTKYQIVYTKLETTLFSIIRTTDARKKARVARAFNKMVHNAKQLKVKRENREKLVVVHFENKLNAFASAVTRYNLYKQVQSRFSKWKNSSLTQSKTEGMKNKTKEEIDKIEKEIGINQAIVSQYEEKLNASSQENQAAVQKIEDSQYELSELDIKQKELKAQTSNADASAARKTATANENRNKQSTELKQKIKKLQDKILALREENVQIQEKQEATNGSIGDYISEMSTMLSSAELESALHMENADTESEEDYEQDEPTLEEYDDDNEVRPHAGTGGSSKLRSRPQNQLHS